MKNLKYVSRGGLKLEKALDLFEINLQDKVTLDIGASTGGFTDVMLQNGAALVYAVDVGTNQLAWNSVRILVSSRWSSSTSAMRRLRILSKLQLC